MRYLQYYWYDKDKDPDPVLRTLKMTQALSDAIDELLDEEDE